MCNSGQKFQAAEYGDGARVYGGASSAIWYPKTRPPKSWTRRDGIRGDHAFRPPCGVTGAVALSARSSMSVLFWRRLRGTRGRLAGLAGGSTACGDGALRCCRAALGSGLEKSATKFYCPPVAAPNRGGHITTVSKTGDVQGPGRPQAPRLCSSASSIGG